MNKQQRSIMKIEGMKTDKLEHLVLECIHNYQSTLTAPSTKGIAKAIQSEYSEVRNVLKLLKEKRLIYSIVRVKEEGGYNGMGYFLTDKGMDLFEGYYGKEWRIPE